MVGVKTVSRTEILEEIETEEPPLHDVHVNLGDLRGPGGNAFAVMGAVAEALKVVASPQVAEEYSREAMRGDYRELLLTSARYVRVVGTNIAAVFELHPSSEK